MTNYFLKEHFTKLQAPEITRGICHDHCRASWASKSSVCGKEGKKNMVITEDIERLAGMDIREDTS